MLLKLNLFYYFFEFFEKIQHQYSISIFLNLLLIFPLISVFILFFVKNTNFELIRVLGLSFTVFIFFLSLIIWFFFDINCMDFQFYTSFLWLNSSFFNLEYMIGLDGISIFFIILTTFLIPLCILLSWNNIKIRLKEYIISLILIEFFLLNFFLVMDLILFYIYFESVLIPMFLLIGVWGSRLRKVHAAYQFFLYTLIGSVLLLLGILIIYFQLGTTDIFVFLNSSFALNKQLILWLAFFFPFAVKVPMVPVHIWLPEAHVEAPTAGSVLLAGVLLKLGTYGLLRFVMPVFSYANYYYTPIVLMISLISIIYSSCTTIRQIDLKKIIAYSSVAHMNFVMLGLFSSNYQGLHGSLYLMLSHGIVSGALFICVGILYDRYHSRILNYYGGLATFMPIFSGFFLIFTLANIGLPGTSSFVGEFLIILGLLQFNYFFIFISATSVILSSVYGLWLFNRVMFGQLQVKYIFKFCDLTNREFFLLLPLGFLSIFGGIYPKVFFDTFEITIMYMINYIY